MQLFSWGANTYSQLGNGVKSEQCVLPVEIKTEKQLLDPNNIKLITGGGGHTLILTKHGKVFACGSNSKGQLGLDMDTQHLSFEEIKCLQPYHITDIACGWESSLAITKNGELLVWGSNTYCQLGQSKKMIPFTAIPVKLTVPNVRSVASGLRHSGIVTRDGRVLMCGSGKKGQLGLTDSNGMPLFEAQSPQEIPALEDVDNIACGQHHTVVMTSSGRIFAWGDNKYGQLGLDPSYFPSVFSPMEISLNLQLDTCCKLLSGWTHVAILTGNGKIINWGRNTYGQLGCHEYQRPFSWEPQIMNNVENATQIAIGSEHNIVLLGTGQIVSWGWNEHGNCGIGTEEDVRVPTLIGLDTKRNAVLVGTGAGHSFAMLSDGT
ncbi:secretion-regulating guanine nucleotide exchange factor-like [Periplaneta americana]|uniref:secretion-regulating guanine nucleotide exchange factor-like n=1 Tax=Periplaneta americana TaxID=6978 RepID=UPI0037E89D2A